MRLIYSFYNIIKCMIITRDATSSQRGAFTIDLTMKCLSYENELDSKGCYQLSICGFRLHSH